MNFHIVFCLSCIGHFQHICEYLDYIKLGTLKFRFYVPNYSYLLSKQCDYSFLKAKSYDKSLNTLMIFSFRKIIITLIDNSIVNMHMTSNSININLSACLTWQQQTFESRIKILKTSSSHSNQEQALYIISNHDMPSKIISKYDKALACLTNYELFK